MNTFRLAIALGFAAPLAGGCNQALPEFGLPDSGVTEVSMTPSPISGETSSTNCCTDGTGAKTCCDAAVLQDATEVSADAGSADTDGMAGAGGFDASQSDAEAEMPVDDSVGSESPCCADGGVMEGNGGMAGQVDTGEDAEANAGMEGEGSQDADGGMDVGADESPDEEEMSAEGDAGDTETDPADSEGEEEEADPVVGAVTPAGRCPTKGSGSVTFATEPVDISDGKFVTPTAMAVGDLTGDQLPDVAVFDMNATETKAEWYASPTKIGGTWRRHLLSSLPVQRKFLGASKIADVDGDGNNDIIVSVDNHSNADRSAYVLWWKNPGPSKAESSAWEVHSIVENLEVHHINDMEVTDMDDDGRLDVVVRSLVPNRILMFFQDTPDKWTLRELDSSPYGSRGEGFSVGNIDATHGPDITICGHWLEAPANPRTGDFSTHVINAKYCTINPNTKEAVGDINGDGRLDVVISPAEGRGDAENHVLAWYEAPANPRTPEWREHVLLSNFNAAHTVKLGDMDNDGDLDVVSGVAWSNWGQTKALRVFYNKGAGDFAAPYFVSESQGLYSGDVADIENDGDLDIIGQGAFGQRATPDIFESKLCD